REAMFAARIAAPSSIERAEAAKDHAADAVPFAVAESKARVDAASDAERESAPRVLLGRGDERERVDPEVAIELAFGGDEPTGDRSEASVEIAVGEDHVALAKQRSEEAIACFDALAQEGVRDRVGLVYVVKVSDNAEE